MADDGNVEKASSVSVVPLTGTARAEQVFPTLTADQIARVAAHGERRAIRKGEILAPAGQQVEMFFVVTAGSIELVRPSADGEKIGAVPSTRWLEGCVALDGEGFIKMGPDLSQEDLAAARWPLARPPRVLETSLPGVFAAGDVRRGNVKRVASAVGEGSIAITFVHQALQE